MSQLSSESALHIRWPKYWNFSFNISPFNEYLELISFRIDWFDLLIMSLMTNDMLNRHRILKRGWEKKNHSGAGLEHNTEGQDFMARRELLYRYPRNASIAAWIIDERGSLVLPGMVEARGSASAWAEWRREKRGERWYRCQPCIPWPLGNSTPLLSLILRIQSLPPLLNPCGKSQEQLLVFLQVFVSYTF